MIYKRELMFKKRFLLNFLLCLALLSLGLASPAFGKDDEDSDDEFTLEEITVTAEKREAELQKIPIDISVVRPDDMSMLGVYNVDDLDKIIPEFSATEMAGSFLAITIRNVTTNFWNVFHETTVAMHMDGVQLTRPNGVNNLYYDLQRVEVLKGPQGTLYGRGSTAGSMNIISQKPILDEFSGYLTLQAGNYSLYRSEAALNIPIADKIAIRFAGRTNVRDGFDDSNYGNQHQWAGRTSLNWEPTDKDQILIVYDFEGDEAHGQISTGTVFGTFGDLTIVPHFNPTYDVQTIGPTTLIDMPYKSKWHYGDWVDSAWSDLNSWGIMAQWDHELSWADFTFIYGHRVQREKKQWVYAATYLYWRGFDLNTFSWVYPEDDDGNEYRNSVWLVAGNPSVYTEVTNATHFDSVEARLLSKKTITQGDRYEWVVGAMAQRDNIWTWNYGTANPSWVNILNNSKAVFAQASYSIIDGLHLTGGYRLNWDKKQYAGIVADSSIAGQVDMVKTLSTGVWDLLNHYDYSWDESSYRINLSWEINDSVMPYIQYSKGYKTGNLDFNGNAVEPEILDSYEAGLKSRFFNNRLQVNGSVYYYDYKNYNQWVSAYKCLGYPVYDEDGETRLTDANGNELYVTTPTLEATNAATLALAHACADVASDPDDETYAGGQDGSISNYDYEWQRSLSVSPGGSEQYGVSADITWLITNSDTLTARMTYSHNEYSNYIVAPAVLAVEPEADNPYTNTAWLYDQDGQEFGGSPIRGNMGYTHRMFIGTDMLNFNTTAFYNGKGIDQIVNNNTDYEFYMPGVDAYWTFDASISYNSTRWVPEGMRWNARFQVNNLFNTLRYSSITYYGISSWMFGASSNIPEDAGYFTASYNSPRTLSLTITLNF